MCELCFELVEPGFVWFWTHP